MPRIFAMRNADTVSIYIDGKQTTYKCFDEEEAKQTIALAAKAKAGDETALEELKAKSDPTFKMDHKECPLLQINRRLEVFLKGTTIPMNPSLVSRFIEDYKEGISLEPLINFWKLCLQNPSKEAREGIFKFLSHYNMIITDYGYFIGYKAVYFKGEKNRYLLEKLSKIFIDAKISRKDISRDFIFYRPASNQIEVIKSDLPADNPAAIFEEYVNTKIAEDVEINHIDKSEQEDLYNALEERNRTYFSGFEFVCTANDIMGTISGYLEKDEADSFTDIHSRTMNINIGIPVSMRREDCDSDPNSACSTGLHIGTPEYASNFYGGSDNKVIIACLVNPVDVVAIPYDYDFHKMRTCKYFPYAICEETDKNLQEIDVKYFEEDYRDYEIKSLEDIINSSAEVIIPDMTAEEALELIKDRLKTIGC